MSPLLRNVSMAILILSHTNAVAKFSEVPAKQHCEVFSLVSITFCPNIYQILLISHFAFLCLLIYRMDVIALRKGSGHITGEVLLNGFQQQETSFRRCSGYVEQFGKGHIMASTFYFLFS